MRGAYKEAPKRAQYTGGHTRTQHANKSSFGDVPKTNIENASYCEAQFAPRAQVGKRGHYISLTPGLATFPRRTPITQHFVNPKSGLVHSLRARLPAWVQSPNWGSQNVVPSVSVLATSPKLEFTKCCVLVCPPLRQARIGVNNMLCSPCPYWERRNMLLTNFFGALPRRTQRRQHFVNPSSGRVHR